MSAAIQLVHRDLPGESTIDDRLVNDVVSEVNALHLRRGLELARELGELLLDRFFEGDPDRFDERHRAHASFRALAERADLQVSYVTLWTAVAVVRQLRVLPPELGEALSLAHHRALLAVEDPEARRMLARRAVEEGLSSRALHGEVLAARRAGRTSKAGRPPLPGWLKGLGQAERALASVEVAPEWRAKAGEEGVREMAARIDAQIERLRELRDSIVGC